MKQEEVVHWFHVDEVPTSTPEEYNFKLLQIVSPATPCYASNSFTCNPLLSARAAQGLLT